MNDIGIEDVIGLLEGEINIFNNTKKSISDLSIRYELLGLLLNDLEKYSLDDLKANKDYILIQLDTIFKDKVYQDNFYSLLINMTFSMNSNDIEGSKMFFKVFTDQLYKEFNKIGSELTLLKLNLNDEKINNYKRVMIALKCNQCIVREQLEILFNFLKEKNFDNVTVFKICNLIRIYNERHFPTVDKSMFDDISFDFNFVKYPEISLDSNANSTIDIHTDNLLEYSIYDKSLVYTILPVYGSCKYDEIEYKKLYFDLMNKIQDQIRDVIEFFDEFEYFYDFDTIKYYKNLVKFYGICSDFFNEQLLKINEENDNEQSDLDNVNSEDVAVRFYFSMSDDVSFFENDLKSIRKEAYSRIAKLLKQKRYGKISPSKDKQLLDNDIFKQYRELKDDQVRIIYKNYDGNSIVICGVGIKQKDNDILLYRHLIKRKINIPNDILLLGDDAVTFDRIIDMCSEMGRKGR